MATVLEFRRVLFRSESSTPARSCSTTLEHRAGEVPTALGPFCGSGAIAAPGPLAFLPPRFPGERRDPGTTEHWTATKRTSGHQGLCGTEGAFFWVSGKNG